MDSGEDNTTSEGNNSTHCYEELYNSENSAGNSANTSRPGSSGGPHKRGRVRFNSTSEANDTGNKRWSLKLRDESTSPTPAHITSPRATLRSSSHGRNGSYTSVLRHSPAKEIENPFEDPVTETTRSRPKVPHHDSSQSCQSLNDLVDQDEKTFSALAAQSRAQRNASLVGSYSMPITRRNSLSEDVNEFYEPPRPDPNTGLPVRIDDIPLVDMGKKTYDGTGSDSEDDDFRRRQRKEASTSSEAHKLVRAHTRKYVSDTWTPPVIPGSGLASGQITPMDEKQAEEYVPRPQQYRGGVLSSLLKLYSHPPGTGQGHSRRTSDASDTAAATFMSLGSSGINTPRSKPTKWYKNKNQSQETLSGLVEASNILGGIKTPTGKRPGMGKRASSSWLFDSAAKGHWRPRLEDEIRITVHIAETLSRQKYLLKLCRALMIYGAPTHRLEEYLKMTARVLEIDGQFLYIPGCMIISFDDASTHTTEVKLVKAAQGVNLGKLKDVHEIYKEVVHDVIGVEEATQRLETIMRAKPKFNKWFLVLMYGFASMTVAPFAFEGRLIDLPICFILGCLLGFLQLVVAPKSDLYSNVFEISASVLTSFLARAFGSINSGKLFCFSALAQSSIALILPGYLVLCASLELQSRSMIAGSVRIVYAIIYSLFLGFGIMIGTSIYGFIDPHAVSTNTCSNTISPYYRFFFVPAFTLALAIINQAKWRQVPVMLLIAFAGYIVTFFAAKAKHSSAQIGSALGAFTVGVLGNLYSRMRHGVAAAALLPAICLLVPSGLAASGSLLQGISGAEQITSATKNETASSVGVAAAAADVNGLVFNVGFNMIQVAIGITVGLFLSALVVYPLGKRRSGLFSF